MAKKCWHKTVEAHNINGVLAAWRCVVCKAVGVRSLDPRTNHGAPGNDGVRAGAGSETMMNDASSNDDATIRDDVTPSSNDPVCGAQRAVLDGDSPSASTTDCCEHDGRRTREELSDDVPAMAVFVGGARAGLAGGSDDLTEASDALPHPDDASAELDSTGADPAHVPELAVDPLPIGSSDRAECPRDGGTCEGHPASVDDRFDYGGEA
jgi:hypothetical protein